MEALMSQVFQFLMDYDCSLGNAISTSFIAKTVNRDTFSKHLITAKSRKICWRRLELEGFAIHTRDRMCLLKENLQVRVNKYEDFF